jgi:hypothetical protein
MYRPILQQRRTQPGFLGIAAGTPKKYLPQNHKVVYIRIDLVVAGIKTMPFRDRKPDRRKSLNGKVISDKKQFI